MIKLSDIISKINLDVDYNKLESFIDKNLFESYAIIGELLNPNGDNIKENKIKYLTFKF